MGQGTYSMCVSKPSIFFPMLEHGKRISLLMFWENSSFQLSTIATKQFSGERLQSHVLASPRRQAVRSRHSRYMYLAFLSLFLLQPFCDFIIEIKAAQQTAFGVQLQKSAFNCKLAFNSNWTAARRSLYVYYCTSFPWKRSGSLGESRSKWIRKEGDRVGSNSTCTWKSFAYISAGWGWMLFVCVDEKLYRPNDG